MNQFKMEKVFLFVQVLLALISVGSCQWPIFKLFSDENNYKIVDPSNLNQYKIIFFKFLIKILSLNKIQLTIRSTFKHAKLVYIYYNIFLNIWNFDTDPNMKGIIIL